MTPASAPNQLERGLPRIVRLSFTEAEAAKFGLEDRYRRAVSIGDKRRASRSSALERLQAEIAALLSFAEKNELSRRQLLKVAGISWGTWCRCQSGQTDAAIWLPKIQSAWPNVRSAAEQKFRSKRPTQ